MNEFNPEDFQKNTLNITANNENSEEEIPNTFNGFFTPQSANNDSLNNLNSEFSMNAEDKLEISKKAIKTGTTIVGLRYNGGIVIAADTRATSGPIVADKNCEKIHRLHTRIYACGAGTAADADRVTRLCARTMAIHCRKYDLQPRISHTVRFLRNYLFNRNGYISAALVIGGCDDEGAHLYSVSPHGYFNREEFTAMGSGYYAAMGILEAKYTQNLSKEEAVDIAVEAVKAGILNDLYSGSNVDVCVISDNVDFRRNYCKVSVREDIEKLEKYPLQSIKITKEEIFKIVDIIDE